MPLYVACPYEDCTSSGPHTVVGKAESSGPTPGKVLQCVDNPHQFIVYADGSTQTVTEGQSR